MEGEKKRKLDLDLSVDKRIIFLGLMVVFVLSMTGGQNPIDILNDTLKGKTTSSIGIGSTAPIKGQQYSGQLDIKINHRDALDNTETRTEGKDLRTTFYKQKSNGDFVMMGSGDFSGVQVDDDKIFFTLTPLKDDIYIAPSYMSDWKLNPRIQTFDHLDVNNDGIREWLFQVDMTELSVNPYNIPTIALYTMSYDQGELYLNHPSDFMVFADNSINNIRWELEVPPEKAVAIKQVNIILDTTDSSLLNIENSWIKIPFIDNIEFSEMERIVKYQEIEYEYNFGNTLGDADYVMTKHNTNPFHDMTVRLHTHLPEGEELNVILKVTAITPSEAFVSVQDNVKLTATSDESITDNVAQIPINEELLGEIIGVSWDMEETNADVKCAHETGKCGDDYKYTVKINSSEINFRINSTNTNYSWGINEN